MLLNVLIAIVASFFFAEAVGFFIHKLAHWPGSGKLFRNHLHHHAVIYPPENYTTKKYVANVRTSFLPVFVPLFIVCNAVAWTFFSWPIALIFFLMSSGVSLVSNYMHDSFHVENHWLDRFRWHRLLRELHHVHHKHTRKNLGIYMFLYDRLFRSFKYPKLKS